jgi:molybdenum cofactor cytidylyltransferase
LIFGEPPSDRAEGLALARAIEPAGRPVRNDAETPHAPAAARTPRVAALILAAGASLRMGGENKLLRVVGGRPLVRHAADAAIASRCTQVLVVTGCEAESVESNLDPDRVAIIRNPDFARGMSTSLRCGLAALPMDTAAVVVVLADMPRVTAAHIDRILGAFDPARPAIVVPTFQGRRGNPVLWPGRYFAELRGIVGDTGARGLLAAHAAEVVSVPIESDAILVDVDTPADLAALSRP